jgi:hypothetical protein
MNQGRKKKKNKAKNSYRDRPEIYQRFKACAEILFENKGRPVYELPTFSV